MWDDQGVLASYLRFAVKTNHYLLFHSKMVYLYPIPLYCQPFHTSLIGLVFTINELVFKVRPITSDLPDGHLGFEKGRGKNIFISSCIVPITSVP